MEPKKVQKQGRDERTQEDYPTSGVYFCRYRVAFLHSFISALFLYFFRLHPYLKSSFTETFFPSCTVVCHLNLVLFIEQYLLLWLRCTRINYITRKRGEPFPDFAIRQFHTLLVSLTLINGLLYVHTPQPKRNRTFYLQRRWACPTKMSPSCSKAVARIHAPFLTYVLSLCGKNPCRCANHGWMNL